MNSSLKSALTELIDYAGLFPPQSHDLETAVDEYFQYVSGKDGWIVSRFVCPAKRLSDLQTLLQARPNRPDMPVSVIGTGGADLDTWETNLEDDARLITAFEEAMGESAPIEAFEIALPGSGEVAPVIKDLKAFESIEIFLEVPLTMDLSAAFDQMADVDWILAKARTGSVRAEDIPTADQLAKFLKEALDTEVPFKLTAGLHQPFAHHDASVGAELFGFLNVLVAITAHLREDLAMPEWVRILTDQDSKNWSLQPGGVEYMGTLFSWEELEDARSFFIAVGSCSVDEPLEALEAFSIREVAR